MKWKVADESRVISTEYVRNNRAKISNILLYRLDIALRAASILFFDCAGICPAFM